MRLAAVVCAVLIAGVLAPSAGSSLGPQTIAFWDDVAQCETGGNWDAAGPTYQGGLGIYWSTWNWWAGELGLRDDYPDADDAPRMVQIRVADYGYRVHSGYWGCIG